MCDFYDMYQSCTKMIGTGFSTYLDLKLVFTPFFYYKINFSICGCLVNSQWDFCTQKTNINDSIKAFWYTKVIVIWQKGSIVCRHIKLSISGV